MSSTGDGDNGEGASAPLRPSDPFDAHSDDASDVEDPGLPRNADAALLSEEDFLSEDTSAQVSSKRKQKQPVKLSLPKFFQPLPGTPPLRAGEANTPLSSARIRRLREQSSHNNSDTNLSEANGHVGGESGATENTKEGGPVDWYGDGPRRRVGYDDLTAIDWIFEYTKERQRLRMLYSRATGILGQLNKLWDSSQVWIILIATGIAAGILAASIDIVADWLGDIRTGYCYGQQGARQFYLSKEFCCWGHDRMADCQDWNFWGDALHISAASGRYIVEYIFFVVLSVLFATCASLLVRNYAQYAKQSGIPEIKTVLGGFVIQRFMGGWTLLIKSIGLCLAVSSGLWLGKEGPLVHVACCCANLLLKLSTSISGNEARKREILSAAASAGISVAFGSPIGGVLFSLEQLSYYFPDTTMWQSFVCAMVAAVVLQVMNPFRTEQLVLYQVSYSTGYHGFELLPFAVLGIVGGIHGGLFIKLNMKIAHWRRNLKISQYPVLEVYLVAMVTALINFPNKFMRARPAKLVHILFAECDPNKYDPYGICQFDGQLTSNMLQLLSASALGFLFTSVTFGLKLPAGIILPTMAIGALYGRVVGTFVQILQQSNRDFFLFANCEPDKECVTPGTYAIVGAAAALGGVTRMTVSIVVIMFELTGALTYVLPIMIAVMLSKWIGDAFGKRGIYESWIQFYEYPFLDNRDDHQPPDIPASQVMTKIEELATISAVGHTLASLQEFLQSYPFRGFPIVASDSSNIFLGYITRTELSHAIKTMLAHPRKMSPDTSIFFSHQPHADPITTVDFRPWTDQTPITLNSRTTFQMTVDMFLKLGLKYVLFIDKGYLQGILTKKDIWYVLNSVEDEGVGEDLVNTPRLNRGYSWSSARRGLLTPVTPTATGMISPFHDR